ncbi:MAG: NUDIX hydrolase [Gaiellaceae bacterium]
MSLERVNESVVVRALARTRCGAYLLVRRSASEHSFAGQWELPGGKVESGEQATAALRRELAEEVGVTCTSSPALVAKVDRGSGRSKRTLELCYLVETDGEPALSAEHDGVCLYRPGSRLPGVMTDWSADLLRAAA